MLQRKNYEDGQIHEELVGVAGVSVADRIPWSIQS